MRNIKTIIVDYLRKWSMRKYKKHLRQTNPELRERENEYHRRYTWARSHTEPEFRAKLAAQKRELRRRNK
jgi:hypothetical protein